MGRAGGGGTTRGGAASLTTAGFGLAGLGGASALLTGPGFAPARAAARILAVSRCTPVLLPVTTGLAVADLAGAGLTGAGLAAGAGWGDTGFAAAASAPPFCLAMAKISATLGRPPPAVAAAGFGAGCWIDSTATAGSPGRSTTDAGSAFAGAAPPFSARAAASISATDIFFFSAIASSWQRACEPCKSRFVRVWEAS